MCRFDNGTLEVTSKHRLPQSVIPRHYALTLRPDLENFTYQGGVVIDVRIRRTTDTIVLNARDLQITEAFLTDATGSRINATVTLEPEYETATIHPAGTVGKGMWKLHIAFAGEINAKLHGFYRSFYTDDAGKQHVIASTQFEPGDARRAFPCFDEPSFKAKYTLRLVVDPHLTAISNGVIVKEEVVEESKEVCVNYGDGLKFVVSPARSKRVVEFKTTRKFSTYLVAWVIGEFEATESINVNGTVVRVLTPVGKKHLATTALKAAQFSLTWFERYFGIRYQFGKLDMIAIPNFAFGAMENSGCITYRETALLVNSLTATIAEMTRVISTVAHEIAHQWFGNLVTMRWWNGLWLNEAFATLMAAMVVDSFKKEWDHWTGFGIDRAFAMRIDGLLSSRPVEGNVVSAQQAQGAFDAITYRKGCSVLRQLEQYIGPEAFRKGIAKYLKEHAWANTEGQDLWNALTATSGQPVAEIMQNWVFQAGHPVVTVGESDVSGCITIKQQPFKYLADQADNSLSWEVPVKLRYKTKSDGVQSQWVLVTEGEQTVYLGEDLEWVVANADGHGFYRTRYSKELAAKVTGDVQSTLSAIERFNLVNDAWACTQAGLQTVSEYVDIVKLFGGETDPNVWSVISGSLARLHGMLPTANQPAFQKMVQALARPAFDRLGWQVRDGESPKDGQVRGTLISLLGTVGGDTEVQSKADELFTAYKKDASSLPAEIVPAVVRLVAHTGDSADHSEFLRLHAGCKNPQEAVRYLSSLADFQDEELLETSLNVLVDGTARTQDASALTVRFLSNSVIAAKAWEFVKNNWEHIVANYPENGLISMVQGVTALDTPELEADVRRFFAKHKVRGGDKAVAQSLEMLHVSVLFNQNQSKALAGLFPAA